MTGAMLDGVVGMDHRKTSLKANIKLEKKKQLSFFLLKKPNVTLPFFVCQTRVFFVIRHGISREVRILQRSFDFHSFDSS